MRGDAPRLHLISLPSGWRERHMPSKKWQWPCGKVVSPFQPLDNKGFHIRCLGTRHAECTRYSKVVPEFLQDCVGLNAAPLNMLIRVDKHRDILGAATLTTPLVAAGVAIVAHLNIASTSPSASCKLQAPPLARPPEPESCEAPRVLGRLPWWSCKRQPCQRQYQPPLLLDHQSFCPKTSYPPPTYRPWPLQP